MSYTQHSSAQRRSPVPRGATYTWSLFTVEIFAIFMIVFGLDFECGINALDVERG